MSQYVDGNVKGFIASGAITAFTRVKHSGTAKTVETAGAGEDWIGTAETTVADGKQVNVRLRTAAGTRKMVAAGALSIGDVVYGAASGKIDDTAAGQAIGYALEAATADGDIIEVVPACDLGEQTHIADPSGGTTVDAEARTAINSILDALEAVGILATS